MENHGKQEKNTTVGHYVKRKESLSAVESCYSLKKAGFCAIFFLYGIKIGELGVRVYFNWINNCSTNISLSKNCINFINPGLQRGGEK